MLREDAMVEMDWLDENFRLGISRLQPEERAQEQALLDRERKSVELRAQGQGVRDERSHAHGAREAVPCVTVVAAVWQTPERSGAEAKTQEAEVPHAQ